MSAEKCQPKPDPQHFLSRTVVCNGILTERNLEQL